MLLVFDRPAIIGNFFEKQVFSRYPHTIDEPLTMDDLPS
jgi:hypothetical protein